MPVIETRAAEGDYAEGKLLIVKGTSLIVQSAGTIQSCMRSGFERTYLDVIDSKGRTHAFDLAVAKLCGHETKPDTSICRLRQPYFPNRVARRFAREQVKGAKLA